MVVSGVSVVSGISLVEVDVMMLMIIAVSLIVVSKTVTGISCFVVNPFCQKFSVSSQLII